MLAVELLVCRCDDQASDLYAQAELLSDALTARGVAYRSVADLCRLAVRDRKLLQQWLLGEVRIAACSRRVVHALGHWSEVADVGSKPVAEYRTMDLDQMLAVMLAPGALAESAESWQAPVSQRRGWFPVIDPQACNHCRQCLDFCLFGVYQQQHGRVQVVEPGNCKNLCPACARVCRQGAIMFPKSDEPSINGSGRPAQAAPGTVDVDQLIAKLGDRVLDAVRNRRAAHGRRFAGQPEDRLQVLQDLKDELGIPQSVIDQVAAGETLDRQITDACRSCRSADDRSTGESQA